MSNNTTVKCLENVAAFVGADLGKLELGPNSLLCRKSCTTGFLNILVTLLQESKSSLLANITCNNAEVLQWIEYTLLYVANADTLQKFTIIFSELNSILRTRTYLIGQSLTIADVVLFYYLHPVIKTLSYLEKEKFVNLSRWFDNLQQSEKLRLSEKLIDFPTNHLSCVVPVRV